MMKKGELTVTKSNKFVQEYNIALSLTETRIVNYLIANIESPKYDKEFKKFRFEIKEFCDMVYADKKQGNAYKWLPKIIQDLSNKSAWKEVPSTENPGKTKKVLIRWIERPEFEDGFVTLELNPYLAPYLLGLDKNFFQASFEYSAKAKSKYTIPLYELLKSWEKVKTHQKKFDVLYLRQKMDALEKSKDNVSEFKRRALDPAIKEINEITDLYVEYAEEKHGRKTTHIIFTIKHKEVIKEIEEKRVKEEKAAEELYEEILDVSLHLPNNDTDKETENEPEDRLSFWAEALNKEFTIKQVRELVMLAQKNIEINSNDSLYGYDIEMYNYLRQKYISLDAKKNVKNRYGLLRDMINNNYN